MLIIFGVDIYSARVVALGLVYTLQCVDGRAVFTQIRTIRLVSLLLCEPVKCTTYLLTFLKKIALSNFLLCHRSRHLLFAVVSTSCEIVAPKI